MSIGLAFRSSKLAYKSNKLGVRQIYYPCGIDYNLTQSGYATSYAFLGICSAGWPYTDGVFASAWDQLLNDPNSDTSQCAAVIRYDHSHGTPSLNQFNECSMMEGWRGFLKPAEVPDVVSAAFLRIYNCGCVRHTILYDNWVPYNYYAGNIPILLDANYSLFLTVYINSSIRCDWSVSLPTIRTLNGANGVIAAGMGRYTYKMNGYVDVVLPSAALAILTAYTGCYLAMAWGFTEAYPGGYCPKCLGDYVDTGYTSRLNASAVICTSTMLAANPQLYVAS